MITIDRILQMQEEYISALECMTRLKEAMGNAGNDNGLGDAYLCAKYALDALRHELVDECRRVLNRLEVG